MLGLSATVTRRDGHDPIILMQCGPVRYRVQDKAEAHQRGFEHHVVLRDTGFELPISIGEPIPSISEGYRALGRDAARNALMVDDIRQARPRGVRHSS